MTKKVMSKFISSLSCFFCFVILCVCYSQNCQAQTSKRTARTSSNKNVSKPLSGTLVFNINQALYKKKYDYYPGTLKKTGSYQEVNYGKKVWTQYLAIHSDGRIVKLNPDERKYIGKVKKNVNGAIFILIEEHTTFGEGCKLWRDGKVIGSTNGIGGYYKTIVVDTKTKCIYKSESDYNNRDISSVEYYKYDSFINKVMESSDSEYEVINY